MTVNSELPFSVGEIPLYTIRPSRWQPRQRFDEDALIETATSIRDRGLINEILVFKQDGQYGYELIAGERRTRCRIAIALSSRFPNQTFENWVRRLANVGITGLGENELKSLRDSHSTIRAKIYRADDMNELHLLAITENIDRQQLTALEEARGFQSLIDDYEWSQRELAERLGKSQGYVAQRLSLLNLGESVQEALEAGELTFAGARAFASAPQELQGALVEQSRNMTTRELEGLVREIKTFLSPGRWLPCAGGKVYRPQEYNRLRMIREAVEQADLQQVAERVLELRTYGVRESNYLRKQPISIVGMPEYVRAVLAALDNRYKYATPFNTMWKAHAQAAGRMCENCQFYLHSIIGAGPAEVHCGRWVKDAPNKFTTCDGYIGEDDPVVIPVRHGSEHSVKEHALYSTDVGYYMNDVAAYVEVMQDAIRNKNARSAQYQDKLQARHIPEMQEYWSYVENLRVDWYRHPQAHACQKCRFYAPMYEMEDLPPCRLVRDPVQKRFGQGTRAPHYGLLIGENGMVLPRCEAFAYRELPKISTTLFMDFNGYIAMVTKWLSAICGHGPNMFGGNTLIHNALASWLDYGWDVNSGGNTQQMARFVRDRWEDLGGDSGVAKLIEVARLEYRAMHTMGIRYLKDPSGNGQRWYMLQFKYLSEPYELDYPKEFVKPWELKLKIKRS